jgi:hypothetical protein
VPRETTVMASLQNYFKPAVIIKDCDVCGGKNCETDENSQIDLNGNEILRITTKIQYQRVGSFLLMYYFVG